MAQIQDGAIFQDFAPPWAKKLFATVEESAQHCPKFWEGNLQEGGPEMAPIQYGAKPDNFFKMPSLTLVIFPCSVTNLFVTGHRTALVEHSPRPIAVGLELTGDPDLQESEIDARPLEFFALQCWSSFS